MLQIRFICKKLPEVLIKISWLPIPLLIALRISNTFVIAETTTLFLKIY